MRTPEHSCWIAINEKLTSKNPHFLTDKSAWDYDTGKEQKEYNDSV